MRKQYPQLPFERYADDEIVHCRTLRTTGPPGSPDLPGCITTGPTLAETEQNIREAISGHVATLRQFGEPVPEPSSTARDVEFTPAA